MQALRRLAMLTVLALTAGLQAAPMFTMDPVWFFAGDSLKRELELNLMVQRASLDWIATVDGSEAGYTARLRVTQAMQTVADTSWTRSDWNPPGRDVSPTEKIPDQCVIVLPTGLYRYQLTVEDRTSSTRASKSARMELPEGRPGISGIRLGVQAAVPTEDSLFARRGLFLVPYADALYGPGLDQLHAIVELQPALPPDETRWTRRLLGERQNVLESSPWALLSEALLVDGETQLMSLQQPLGHVPSGSYLLELELEHQGRRVSTRRPFWVKNPDVARPEQEITSDEYGNYGPEELSLLWDATRVIASPMERSAWETMDLNGRRVFLRDFWRRRDPDPSTGVNEEKMSFLFRVEEAKRRFREPGREGHLTERGGIFVKYGPPEEVETDFGMLNSRYEFTLNSYGSNSGMGSDSFLGSDHNDFELWIYERLDGGVEFIFIDIQGFGEYELAHSTKSGEFYDPNWGRKLFR